MGSKWVHQSVFLHFSTIFSIQSIQMDQNGSEMGPKWVRNSIEQVRHLLDLNNWNVGYVPVDYNWLEVFQMWVRYLVGNV